MCYTRKPYKPEMLWSNLELLVDFDVPFYITFTSVMTKNIRHFWDLFNDRFPHHFDEQYKNANIIDLIEYKALPHVDDVPWGKQV